MDTLSKFFSISTFFKKKQKFMLELYVFTIFALQAHKGFLYYTYIINTCLVIISLTKYILHNAIGKNHTIIYLQTQNLPSSHFRK